MRMPFHPAPGLGDLVGGFFVVPQNPIMDAGTPMVPSVQAQYPNRITRRPRMGDLVAASFVVPQNPLLPNAQPMSQAGLGCASCSGANFYGMSGLGQTFSTVMGDFTGGNFSQGMTDFSAWIQESSIFPSVPNWAVVGGGAVALMMLMGAGAKGSGGGRRRRNPHRRNIAAGYHDEDGYFHPIRASYDYDGKRAGDPPKAKAKTKRRRR